MKIQVQTSKLIEGLLPLQPLAGKNKHLIITSNVKVVTKGNYARLQATDGEVTIRTYIELNFCDTDGDFLVDCAALVKYATLVRSETVEIEVDQERMRISHGKGKYTLAVLPTDDFPEIADSDATQDPIKVQSDIFTQCLPLAASFAGTDPLRPQMYHVNCEVDGSNVTLAATDARTLFFDTQRSEITTAEATSFQIAAPAIPHIIKAAKKESAVIIEFRKQNIIYSCGSTKVYAPIPTGKFPDCRRVIPGSWNIECEVSNTDLAEAIQRAAIAADDNSLLLKVNIKDGMLSLTGEFLAKGRIASEQIPCETKGEEITIGIKAPYLIDALKCSADTDKVTLRLTDPARPLVMYNPSQPRRTILILPMTLS